MTLKQLTEVQLCPGHSLSCISEQGHHWPIIQIGLNNGEFYVIVSIRHIPITSSIELIFMKSLGTNLS